MSRRSNSKYPALDPNLNLRVRRSYIEADYIDGVRNSSGEEVIRPLTDQEKEWLNKFYKETIVTSFKKDGSDFYDDVEDQRSLYRDNNKRNTCLYNFLHRINRIAELDVDSMESYFEVGDGIVSPESIMIKIDEMRILSEYIEYFKLVKDKIKWEEIKELWETHGTSLELREFMSLIDYTLNESE